MRETGNYSSQGRDKGHEKDKLRDETRGEVDRTGRRRSKSYRSRSRSKSKERERSSRGDRKRSKDRKRRKSSSSRSSSDSSRASSGDSRKQSNRHHRDRSHGRRSDYKSYRYQEPNCTVMVRGLALHLDESDIWQEIASCGLLSKDIRLIRNHETGSSRGYAFVEFNDLKDAKKWIETKKGMVMLRDRFPASLIYSAPRITGKTLDYTNQDEWLCTSCQALNFKRRQFCYKCDTHKSKSDTDVGPTSTLPTTLIVLSNLNKLTTEEGVLVAFQANPKLASIPIRRMRILRNQSTLESMGECFVETNTLSEAVQLFDVLIEDGLEVCGNLVSVAYGKFKKSSKASNISKAEHAVAAASWTNNVTSFPPSQFPVLPVPSPPCLEVKTENDAQAMAEYWSRLYAKNFEEYVSYLDYYKKFYNTQLTEESISEKPLEASATLNFENLQTFSNCIKTPVVVAASIQFSLRKSPPHGSQFEDSTTTKPDVFPKPSDANCHPKYLKEEKGFNNNLPSTGFCGGRTFSHQENADYPQTDNNSTLCSSGTLVQTKEPKEGKHEQKNVVKNVEKWMKRFNKNIGKRSSIISTTDTVDASISEIGSTHNFESIKSMPSTWTTETSGDYLVDNRNFIDETRLLCLLCKRKFKSAENLIRHVKMSELHENNLKSIK